MTGLLLPISTTKYWLLATGSSSKPYSGSTAVREEETSDRAGEDSHASRDKEGEFGAGTGSGDGERCGGSSDWEM